MVDEDPDEDYICPLTKEKCNKDKCKWYMTANHFQEDFDVDCAIYHIVGLLVEIAENTDSISNKINKR